MDIMIDIETLGLEADAKILQIGVATTIANQLARRSFKLDPDKQPDRTISPSTQKWWSEQDPQVRAEVFSGQLSLAGAMEALCDWIHEMTTRRGVPEDEVEFWCRGMEFDFLILEDALRKTGHKIPWKFYQKNDLRTLSKLIPQIPAPKNPSKHNAAMDAMYQLEHLHALKRAVNESVLFIPRNTPFLPT